MQKSLAGIFLSIKQRQRTENVEGKGKTLLERGITEAIITVITAITANGDSDRKVIHFCDHCVPDRRARNQMGLWNYNSNPID
jgi:hypothetical protein